MPFRTESVLPPALLSRTVPSAASSRISVAVAVSEESASSGRANASTTVKRNEQILFMSITPANLSA